MLRAALGAAHVCVTSMAPGITGDSAQPCHSFCIAHVADERPCAVERRWPQVVRIPAHYIARGVAHPAADALDTGVSGLPRRRIGPHAREIIGLGARTFEVAAGALPFVEEGAHVSHQGAN